MRNADPAAMGKDEMVRGVGWRGAYFSSMSLSGFQ